jgi:hypothetical protein
MAYLREAKRKKVDATLQERNMENAGSPRAKSIRDSTLLTLAHALLVIATKCGVTLESMIEQVKLSADIFQPPKKTLGEVLDWFVKNAKIMASASTPLPAKPELKVEEVTKVEEVPPETPSKPSADPDSLDWLDDLVAGPNSLKSDSLKDRLVQIVDREVAKLRALVHSRDENPLTFCVESVQIDGQIFVILITKIARCFKPSSQLPDRCINVNGVRADLDAAVCKASEDYKLTFPNGTSMEGAVFAYALAHKPGRHEIRMWINRQNADGTGGDVGANMYIRMTAEAPFFTTRLRKVK